MGETMVPAEYQKVGVCKRLVWSGLEPTHFPLGKRVQRWCMQKLGNEPINGCWPEWYDSLSGNNRH